MNWTIGRFTLLLCAFMLYPGEGSAADGVNSGGDVLNEAPIWPVPPGMTLEEYTDANRRLGVGLALMSVPIPGALHFYAGERREGWMHVGAAALGGASILLGAAMLDGKENAWKKTDFETVDIEGTSGEVVRYEKIPVEEEGGVYTYRLKELERKAEGAGAALVALGAGLLVGQLLHDLVDGIKTIERKRDAVRYKYGKSTGYELSLNPDADIEQGRLGARLSLRF